MFVVTTKYFFKNGKHKYNTILFGKNDTKKYNQFNNVIDVITTAILKKL